MKICVWAGLWTATDRRKKRTENEGSYLGWPLGPVGLPGENTQEKTQRKRKHKMRGDIFNNVLLMCICIWHMFVCLARERVGGVL